MVTRSTRDVKMVLSVESLGQENIGKLQKALQDLATTGGASTAEFSDLADQIGRLGEQGAALQAFKALAAETENLQQKQDATGASAQALSAKLDLTRAAADQAKVAQLSVRQELIAGEKAYIEAGNALRSLKAQYQAAGKEMVDFGSRQEALVAQQNAARIALVDLKDANKSATAAVKAAVTEQTKSEAAYKRAATQAAAAGAAVKQQAESLTQLGNAAKELGVDVDDLARAEAELLSTFARGTSTLTARRQAVSDMAEADRLAKIEAEGLAEIQRRGEAALQAEILAQRDAEKAVIAYTAAKNKAAADSAQWQREADQIVTFVEATQRAAKELRELAAINAFEKQASETQRLIQAAQYVQFWEQALEEAEVSAAKFGNALNTLNVRSVEAVREEIAQTSAAMRTLADSGQLTGGALAVAMSRGQERINALQREVRELTGNLTLADRAAKLLDNSMGQISAGNLVADGIGYLVEKVKEMGRAFLAVVVQTESTRKALQAIYKDAGVAASQMLFLRSAAGVAGVSIAGITDDFVKFSAATQSANIPLEHSNAVFEALTHASSTLGLGAEKTSLALNALGQIASKGVVSMEELRQQLGDSIPGALSLTAKGLNITDAELIKLVETGQLAARDFFPAFTEGLKTLQGETDGIRQTWERFKNVLALGAVAAESNGALVLLTGTLKVFGGLLSGIALGLSVVVEGLLSVGRVALLLFGIFKGEGREAFAFFNEESSKMVDRLTEQANAFNAMLDPSKENLARLTASAAANAKLAGTTSGVTSSITLNTAELATNAKQAALSEAGALAQAKANQVTQSTTLGVTEQWVKLNVELVALAAQQTANVVVSQKLVKAAEQEGIAAVRLAELRGSEIGVLQATAEAASRNSAALTALAAAREAEAAVLRVQANELAKLAIEQDGSIEKRAVEIQAIADKVEKLDAEASAARNAAEAARIESKERELSVQIYRDNSAAVKQLAAARDEAAANLAYAIDLEKIGLRTAQDVKFAQEELGAATRVYNDALQDSITKIDQASRAKVADLSVTEAGVSAEQRRYESLAAAARARGDETKATYYSIEAKKREIEQIKLSVQIKGLEIEAARQTILIKQQELDKSDPLYEQKVKELEIKLKLLKVQEIENESKLEAIEMLEEQIANLRTYGNEQGQATEKTRANTTATDQNTTARERNAAAAEKQAEAERKRLNIDKDGFTLDKSGNRLTIGGELTTLAGVTSFLESAGLDEAQARRVAREFSDGRGNILYSGSPGQRKYGGRDSTISDALLKAAERTKFGGQRVGGLGGIGGQDSVENVEQASRAKAADLAVTLASISAEESRYESLATAARARGDETQATYYATEAKKREIEQLKLGAEIKALEIKTARQTIFMQRQELDLADPLYAQKAKELDIRLKLLDVQEIESQGRLGAANPATFDRSPAQDPAAAQERSSTQDPVSAQDRSPGFSTNVIVNIGGRSRTIAVAGQNDANVLVGVLRDLENQSGTAS